MTVVSTTTKQVSINLGPLWQPGVCNDAKPTPKQQRKNDWYNCIMIYLRAKSYSLKGFKDCFPYILSTSLCQKQKWGNSSFQKGKSFRRGGTNPHTFRDRLSAVSWLFLFLEAARLNARRTGSSNCPGPLSNLRSCQCLNEATDPVTTTSGQSNALLQHDVERGSSHSAVKEEGEKKKKKKLGKHEGLAGGLVAVAHASIDTIALKENVSIYHWGHTCYIPFLFWGVLIGNCDRKLYSILFWGELITVM